MDTIKHICACMYEAQGAKKKKSVVLIFTVLMIIILRYSVDSGMYAMNANFIFW